MKYLLIISAVIFLNTSTATAQWTLKNSGTTQHLMDIYFPDNTIGYAVGNHGTVLKTTDAGENWSNIFNLDTTDFTTLHFVNKDTGWVAGNNNAYQTTNGGVSFTSIEPLFGNTDPTKHLARSAIIGAKGNIVIIQGLFAEVPQVNPPDYHNIITKDGGATWQPFTFNLSHDYGVISIVNDTVFYAGNMGLIEKSIDGGNNWIEMKGNFGLGFPPRTWKTFKMFDEAGNGWASLAYHLNSIKTTPLTDTSINIDITQDYRIFAASFLPNNIGYFLQYASGNGNILKSVDWCNHFDTLSSIPIVNAQEYNIHFVDENIGFICGANGSIYKTTTGGITAIQNPERKGVSVYPNPANSTVQISFNQQPAAPTVLAVYDLTGRLLKKTETTQQHTTLDISDLANGLYLIQAKSGEQVLTQKLSVMH